MSDADPAAGPLALLGNAGYRRLWLAGAALGTMRWLEVLGVALWTLAETASPFAVALMLFARTVPMVLLGVPMGALADRVDRRRLLAAGVGANLAVSAILLVLVLAGEVTAWQVAAAAFVNGTVWTMEHPVRRPLIADAVGIARIGPAISLDSATFNATRMTGPLAGGAVYAAFGLAGVFAAGVLAYAAVVALLATGPRAGGPAPAGPREPFAPALVSGLRHVRANALLAGVMGVTVVTNLFGFSYASMVPVIGERVLALDAFMIGVVLSMEGLGALLGALALAFLIRPPLYGRVFVAGALTFVSMVLVFSLSASVALSMAALFLAGAGVAGFGAMQSTILISNAAPAMRSRVMGVLVVCIGAGPPGVLLVGALGAALGAAPALTLTAGLGVAGIALAALRWPVLLASRPPGAPGSGPA